MRTMTSKVWRFLESEDGPTAVEYAIMLALICIGHLLTIQLIGVAANTTFNSISTAVQPGGGP